MRHIAIIFALAFGSLSAIAEDLDPGHLPAQISLGEKPVTWHLSDGTVLKAVEVTKTTKSNWVEIEYILPMHTVPTPAAEPEKPIPATARNPRRRCWVNINQVTRIVPDSTQQPESK
jgi:hypothetical protein